MLLPKVVYDIYKHFMKVVTSLYTLSKEINHYKNEQNFSLFVRILNADVMNISNYKDLIIYYIDKLLGCSTAHEQKTLIREFDVSDKKKEKLIYFK